MLRCVVLCCIHKFVLHLLNCVVSCPLALSCVAFCFLLLCCNAMVMFCVILCYFVFVLFPVLQSVRLSCVS